MSNSSPKTHDLSQHSHTGTLLLALGSLGVVFGDIGTSPLYAVNEIFFGHAMAHYTNTDVIGAISLIFWAITLVISFKYVFFVMNADSDGEGGVYALYSQIRSFVKPPIFMLLLLIFGSGLLYGDGMITPAISVISAVEGLKLITSGLQSFIVPLTIAILTALFAIQYQGTATIGKFFGPIMLLWFATLSVLGFSSLMMAPEILAALNPQHALEFLMTHEFRTILFTLGSVMLVITGGEAMFADMGHFGRLPIRISWYAVAYPALVLNYLGQGAYLLSGREVIANNIFYSMVPHVFLPVVVLLATMATIIASQAMISGAFSLTKQAISLRLLPYLPITYTHKHHEGQIYIPFINWMLYIGSVSLVLIFQSSNRLAGAYGLAVAGDMFITTIAMILIAISIWKWNKTFVYAFFGSFLALDACFLLANSLKLFDGGYIPLSVGFVMFGVIEIWKWGRHHTIKAFTQNKTMTVKELMKIQDESNHDLPRTMIFLSRKTVDTLESSIPIQCQLFWETNHILPEHVVFLTVELQKVPHAKERFTVEKFIPKGKKTGTITSINVHFGFMEDPDIEPLIKRFIKDDQIPSKDPVEHWSIKILHERILPADAMSLRKKIMFAIYSMLHRNTDTSDHYFGLGQDIPLSIDILPVKLK